MHCIFGALHLWCCAFALLTCYALASLVCIIVGALQLWWIISWLQYFFGVLYLRCVASLVLCICTFGMLCIGIFGGASLVWLLLCNASLVHCFLVLGAIYFWCCIFGAMHCQLDRADLLPQWRIYFINHKKSSPTPNTQPGRGGEWADDRCFPFWGRQPWRVPGAVPWEEEARPSQTCQGENSTDYIWLKK